MDAKKLVSFGTLQFISIADILLELNDHVQLPQELHNPLPPPVNLKFFDEIPEERLQVNVERQTKRATDLLKQIYICSRSSGLLDMLLHNNEEICQDFYTIEESYYPKKCIATKNLVRDILEKQGKWFDIEIENYKNGDLFGLVTTQLLLSLPFDKRLSKILIKRNELENLFATLGVPSIIVEENTPLPLSNHGNNEIELSQEPQKTIHTTKNRRSMPLDAVITMAMHSAVNPDDTSSVWAEFKQLSQRSPPPPPLIGYSEDDESVKWQGDSDVKFESRKKFTSRFNRIRKLHSNN